MRIDDHQLKAIRAALEDRRASRIALHLCEHHGHLVKDLSPEELLAEVHAGVRRASGYGITWDSSLAEFLVVMLRTAPNFDEHPRIQRALRDARIDPNRRLRAAVRLATEEDWKRVMESAPERGRTR